MEVMDNDDDMALMNLSKVRENPDFYSDENEEIWSNDHEEVEVLLESYLQAVDGSYNKAIRLGDEIESSLSLLRVKLDSARNHLLRLDIYVSAITSSAGIGAFLAGIFGMNLKSNIENNNNGMLVAGFAIGLFSILFVFILIGYMKYRGWLLDGLA